MMQSIVIDREYGSGGREVAKILAEKLGIDFYDGNMLELAGEQYGIDLGVMKNYDEKRTGSLLHDLALLSDSFTANDEHSEPFRVHDAVSRLIKRLAAEKPCIFLGRCADEILRGQEPFIHVFIYASDMEGKIQRCMEVDGVSRDKAAGFIRQKDSQRKNFQKIFGNGKWDSMPNYDLCINTSAVSYSAAADAIIAAIGES